jgi:hypothetical protein
MTQKRKELDLSSIAQAAGPTQNPVDALIARKAAGTQQGRAGKVQIAGYFPEAMRRRIKGLAAQQGKTIEELLGEALNDLFKKYGAEGK